MAYQKQNFVDGKPLSAEELNHMEEGIAAAMSGGGNTEGGGTADLTGYAKETWVQENYQPKGDYPLRSDLPDVPVQSVNGKTGAVSLSAEDVGARPNTWTPTAADVGALPSTYTPPNQTAQQVGADPAGTAANAVSGHNSAADAHADIRLQLTAISDRLKAFFDSDDQTLDELSEIVAYITSNKSLIDAITTSKVSVLDIVNDLATNVPAKPLSAAQGVVLKGLIDDLSTGKLDASKLQEAIDTALAQAKESGKFDGQRGTGILHVTSSTTSASGTGPTGIAIKYKIAMSTVKDEAGVDEVLVGDTVKRSVYLYPVANVDTSYVYLGAYTSIQGDQGPSGVYVGSDEPTDPDVMVWIDPQGDLLTVDDVVDMVLEALPVAEGVLF